jgi:hypothetical protein|eukprot:evm.model.NODE_23606_length_12981_cov_18.887297.3
MAMKVDIGPTEHYERLRMTDSLLGQALPGWFHAATESIMTCKVMAYTVTTVSLGKQWPGLVDNISLSSCRAWAKCKGWSVGPGT